MNTYFHSDPSRGVVTFDDALLTPTEAAKESRRSIETIRSAYRSGELRAFQPKRNGRVLIPRSALYEWLSRPASRPVDPHDTTGGSAR